MNHFNICSNVDNGVGLEADAKILKSLLESWGYTASLVHYKKRNQVEEAPNAAANIFLEVVSYDLVARNVARENWLIPNPEWFAAHDHRPGLRVFDKILCKTPDAVRIFKKLAENQPSVRFIGFESRDLYDPSIKRERKFLHICGQSRYKNTAATAYAFSRMMEDEDVKPQITIVGVYTDEYAFGIGSKNITTHEHVTDDELKCLMNSHLFHLMPAGYEGWGHSLHESLGCGVVVITSRHPPMNEFDGVAQDLLVPIQDTIVELSAMRARIVAAPIRDIVKKALKMKQEDIDPICTHAREAFLKEKEEFRSNFKKIVEEL